MKTLNAALLAAIVLGGPIPAIADVLLVDSIDRAGASSRPTNGMSMDSVRSRFGEPQQMQGPVGDPPITRWVYGDFTVYFEHSLVLTSVVHR